MHKHLLILSLLISFISSPLISKGEIYKQVDSEGRVTYSNVKLKGSKKLELEPSDTSFGNDAPTPIRVAPRSPITKTATPQTFPKVDSDTQNQRDGARKNILLSELEAEQKALADAKIAYTEGAQKLETDQKALAAAKIAYSEGAQKPEVYQSRNVNGTTKTFRNVAKFDEKMKNLQNDVDAQLKNVAKFDEKMKGLQGDVDAHQRNIDLLTKELSALK